MGPKADIEPTRQRRRAIGGVGGCLLAALLIASAAEAAQRHRGKSGTHAHHTHHVHRIAPLEFPGSQYIPLSWSDVPGWLDDDQLAAFNTFRASCKSIAAQTKPPADAKALGTSLRAPCHAARDAGTLDAAQARKFFEDHFVPLGISRVGEPEGFVTGYYEPIIDGSRTPSEVYSVPVYRRPSNLFVRGVKSGATSMPNKGQVFRKIGRRKLVPYYDRAEIEDGVLSGRGLEISYVKNATDLLFTQIQGSARIRLEDGKTLRINYDAHNGQGYTPVGRILIERNIIPREEMSMQRIREWMEANPDGAKEVRRQNKSYVFFREVQLSDKDEAVGAQGVPLTPGRSIAVDRLLHVYGTPFFIEANLPLESERAATPFRRLMVAQDTGSAIVGPARADIYFGAGAEAGRVSGRLRHGARFVMLTPKSLDPVAAGRTMLLPEPRPSEKIAKLFPAKDPAKPATPAVDGNATPAPAAADKDKPAATTADSKPAASVPSPQARPAVYVPHHKRHRRHRHSR